MNNLKNLRLEKGCTIAQLAALLHTGERVVADWEQQLYAPSIIQLTALCRVLNCRPADLYLCPDSTEKNCVSVPVYKENICCIESYPAHSCESCADFGIVLNCDIGDRFTCGDICFFTINSCAENGDIVLAFTEEDYRICIYSKDCRGKIAAVCTALHRQL